MARSGILNAGRLPAVTACPAPNRPEGDASAADCHTTSRDTTHMSTSIFPTGIAEHSDNTSRRAGFWLLNAFLFVALAISVVVAVFVIPSANWDMIPYIASVEAIDSDDTNEIHRRSYEALREHTSPTVFEHLAEGGPYKAAIFQNPEYLIQQLPFYQIRPAYVLSLYAFKSLGVDVVTAMRIVSAVFTVLAFAVLFVIFYRFISPYSLFLVPFTVIGTYGFTVARDTTPDAMAYFASVAIFYLLLRHRIAIALLLLPILIAVRTDLLVLNACIYAFIFLAYPEFRTKPILFVSAGASVFLFLWINHYYGNYGWNTLVYHEFVSRMSKPAELDATVSPSEYIIGLLKGTKTALRDSTLIFCLLLTSLALVAVGALGNQLERTDKMMFGIMVISWSYVLLHFLAFPSWGGRFFAAEMAAIVVAFLYFFARIAALSGPGRRMLRAGAGFPG